MGGVEIKLHTFLTKKLYADEWLASSSDRLPSNDEPPLPTE
jgi:hypothetical protein